MVLLFFTFCSKLWFASMWLTFDDRHNSFLKICLMRPNVAYLEPCMVYFCLHEMGVLGLHIGL